MSRRYRIRHITTYTYSDRVTSSYGRGFLAPREFEGQRCLEKSVEVQPAPTDQSYGVDVFGNEDVYFHVTSDHDRLVVTADSLVEVDEPSTRDLESGATEPWETARPQAPGEYTASGARATAVEFVLDLVTPEITDGVVAYAEASFPAGRPLREAIVDLTHRIFTDFTYQSGSTTVSTKVADVLEARSGVCQDFARLAIACLRAKGLAARYVSGYLATEPPPGKERMIGVDATHAWAAVWTGAAGWLAFDPTNDQLVDERYTTVAWGRDYADVPPLRGVIYTEAEESSISVSVDVAPVGFPAS
ncbi:MAG: transglutaminase family protein [Rhodococcus fascians]|uniref:transglutaminase family protein n=1 Tax=Nocardiaceae TaxID=85025 RepID=UPI00035C2747|nr:MULTISPECIES: transglutaminase family protein [Rhodococcus]OZC53962.1 transglutaminase family protein [Rhodococcus sp. 06-621-2]OZD05544.1 transglutaminase family protein [Rhodococcus sp. 06-156-4C]OZD16656.1 transglutaminase family protein [Rhodococcus sp. 06-156-4a]OZD26513.1 transglutaminase family protein [Rhodococcus sp. 06-156-3C]OZD31910.1 transglutaminase family protein [Rhodococcus sp. 06-156-3b]